MVVRASANREFNFPLIPLWYYLFTFKLHYRVYNYCWLQDDFIHIPKKWIIEAIVAPHTLLLKLKKNNIILGLLK